MMDVHIKDCYFSVDFNPLDGCTKYKNGLFVWRLNSHIHREDGPAMVFSDGQEMWYRHGKSHREDGPAVIYSDGSQKWYLYSVLHREDGPAIIWPSGVEFWYRHGMRIENPLVDFDWKKEGL